MRIRGFRKGYNQTSLLGYRGYIEKIISLVLVDSFRLATRSSADPEGGQGAGTPGKSQFIWVSIGNMQLDPLEKVGPPPPPPPPLENVGPPEKQTIL